MERFCAVLLLVITLALTGTKTGSAADKPCVIASAQDFLMNVSPHVKKLHVVPPEKLKAYLINVNAARLKVKMFPIVADMMVIGELKREGMIGIIMAKGGCVVPGTESVDTLEGIRKFMIEMNSEDILIEMGLSGISAGTYKT